MKDLMIDIETMGCTHNAVMIQLTGVYFDRVTGEIGDQFCASITEESCKAYGFTTDDSTVDWWAKQDQNILQEIRNNAENVDYIIEHFYQFYKQGNGPKIWSHATFDFPIVQNYLERILGKKMNHKNAHDIRTLVELSGIDIKSYNWAEKTHNALDDCKFQIKYCVDAMNLIRGGIDQCEMTDEDGSIISGTKLTLS